MTRGTGDKSKALSQKRVRRKSRAAISKGGEKTIEKGWVHIPRRGPAVKGSWPCAFKILMRALGRVEVGEVGVTGSSGTRGCSGGKDAVLNHKLVETVANSGTMGGGKGWRIGIK